MTDAEAPEMSAARPENYFDPQDVTFCDLDSLHLFVWRRDTMRRGAAVGGRGRRCGKRTPSGRGVAAPKEEAAARRRR